ncbi:MAG: hypothetical protein RSB39_09850 [Oscillospiraceae bacterium]
MTNEEEKRLTEVEARSKSNTHQIEDLKKRQDNLDALTNSVTKLATKQETMEEDVAEIKSDVKTLTSKSGARWDSIVDKIIWAICGGVLAWLVSNFLGG